MPSTLLRATPGMLEVRLPADADLADPRILQVATYGLVPDAGASPASVFSVELGAGIIWVAHSATDLGARYELAVGPISSTAGRDLPAEKVPFFGAGVAATIAASPEGPDGLRLAVAPDELGILLGTSNLQVRPAVAYPVSPALSSVRLDPDKTVLARGSGWTELSYDVAAGAARERLLWEAQGAGDLSVGSLAARLGPGSSAGLVGILPGAAPVLDLVAAQDGDEGAAVELRLAAGGRRLAVVARATPKGWQVFSEAGTLLAAQDGALALRLALVPATGRFAVLAQGCAILGGTLAALPADLAEGALLQSRGPGAVRALLWLAEVAAADAAKNPLLARASLAPGPPGRVARVLQTLKRPLVASLGPHVPAGPQDVRLTIGGTPVEVASVDPFAGTVEPRVPIPRGTPGVRVEYETTPHLIFPMLASEPGLWAGEVCMPVGPDSAGYPFSAVLDSGRRPRPPRLAHRYLAARRPTSSLLGDPVGLRVGRDPHTGQPPPLVRPRPPVEVELRSAEQASAPPWFLLGRGSVAPGPSGLGLETTPDGSPFFVAQEADLRDIARAYATARLDAGPVSSAPFAPGPAVGFHDESRLYLLAVLDSLGSRYVGVLLDPQNPSDPASWSVWPRTPVSASSRGVVTADPALLPRLLAVGDAMRIPGGPQAGTYRVASLRKAWPSGRVEIGVDPPLPADPEAYGARDATAWFDLGPGTLVLRIEADMRTGSALVSSVGARAVLAQDEAPKPAPGTLLQVESFGEAPGRFLLGHPGGGAPARWGALVGAATPVEDPARIQKREVAGPRALPDFAWAQVGSASADSSEVVASSGPSEAGILRPDRALGPDALSSLDATARALFGAGTLSVQAEMCNGERRILLASLAYDEVPGREPYRQLVFSPAAAAGSGAPPAPPWRSLGAGSWSGSGEVRVAAGSTGRWEAGIHGPGGRLLDLDLEPPEPPATLALELGSGPGSGLSAVLEFQAGILRVLSAGGAEVARRPLPARRARGVGALAPGVGLVLRVEGDPVPLLVPAPLLGDPGAAGALAVTLSNPSRRPALARVYRAAACALPQPGTKHTFGIARDPGNLGDIDAWELPREDATPAKNSDEAGPVIREMDPRADCALRIVLDPEWGAIFLRPDLPPPPYYDPAKARFAGDMTEPSAGWINVSYDELPLAPGGTAYLWLGAGSGARARFAGIREVVEARSAPGEVGFVPRAEVGRDDEANSGDQAQTPFPVVARAVPTSSRRADFKGTGLWLRSLLEVVDGERSIMPPDVGLDPDDPQSILLGAGVAGFSGAPLVVRGNPALPVNEQYLRQLPVRGSPNEVGEGTPPIFERYFSRPDPQVRPNPRSTGRAVEFPLPPPESPLLARSVFTLEDPGQRGLISFPSDDPGEGGTGATAEGGEPIPPPPGPPPDGGGPVIEIQGGFFWDRFRLFDDGTERNFVQLNGPFRPAGGRHRGTPTIEVPPRRPAAVLLPARGPGGRGNPHVVLTGPDGKPIPLPAESFSFAGAGSVTIEVNDGMAVKTFTFTG